MKTVKTGPKGPSHKKKARLLSYFVSQSVEPTSICHGGERGKDRLPPLSIGETNSVSVQPAVITLRIDLLRNREKNCYYFEKVATGARET